MYILSQEAHNLHQLKSPFQTQIFLDKVPLNVNIVKKDLPKKPVFENYMKQGLKGGISIDTDSGPFKYTM